MTARFGGTLDLNDPTAIAAFRDAFLTQVQATGGFTLTAEEAANLEQAAVDRDARLWSESSRRTEAGGNVGAYNNFWMERGTTVVPSRRTSLIVEPSDGRLPQLTAEAQRLADSSEARRLAAVRRGAQPAQSWTDLDAGDRCIQHAKAGPPISVGGYNNNVQLFQAPGIVALLNEQNHDVRIIPLDGRPHVGAQISQWMGDSRGHWEGDTLIVVTKNFAEKCGLEIDQISHLICLPLKPP